jgi:hypothetical protein
MRCQASIAKCPIVLLSDGRIWSVVARERDGVLCTLVGWFVGGVALVVDFVVPSPVPILPCRPSVRRSMFSPSCFTENDSLASVSPPPPPARSLPRSIERNKSEVNNPSARGATTTSRTSWVVKVRPWRAIRRRHSPLIHFSFFLQKSVC